MKIKQNSVGYFLLLMLWVVVGAIFGPFIALFHKIKEIFQK